MTPRPARLYDAAEVQALLQPYAAEGLLLPRSLRYLCENIRDFLVLEAAGRIVACGALHFLDEDLAEIQALAVEPTQQGRGLGGQLVTALLAEAREHQAWKAFALTHAPEFFYRLGFATTEIAQLPRKFARDCAGCPQRFSCRQTAVIRDIFATGPQRAKAPARAAAEAL